MFNFRKKVLGPLADQTFAKIDEACKTQNTTARIENLLSVKEETHTAFSKIENTEAATALAGLFFQIVSIPFMGFAAMLVTSVVLLVAGGEVAIGRSLNANAAIVNARSFKSKIDTEVSNLAAAYPQDAVKSPRFLKALKERFNLVSARETEVNQLRLALAPTPTVQPRATFGL